MRKFPYFEVQHLNRSPVDKVLRRALPLDEPAEAYHPMKYQALINRIAESRRWNVSHLMNAGLLTDAHGLSINLCPPDGAMIKPYPHLCKRHFVCPFCWQRVIVETFVRRVLPLVTNYQNMIKAFPGHSIKTLGAELSIEEWSAPVNSPEEGGELLKAAVSEHRLRVPLNAYGAQSLITVLPAPGTWLVRRKVFSLSSSADVRKGPRKHRRRVQRYVIPSLYGHRLHLIKMLGEACAYPREYLCEYPGEEYVPLVELYRAREHAPEVKLRSIKGVFHLNQDIRLAAMAAASEEEGEEEV